MTEAESNLIDQVLSQFNPVFEHDSPLQQAALKVAQERMPPEFEQTLRELCFRAWDALDAMNAFSKKSALGERLARQFRQEHEAKKRSP